MEKFKLALTERNTKNPRQIRRDGHIPGTIYGPGTPSESVQFSAREFSKLPAAAFSHIVELESSKGKVNALIRNVQRKATSQDVLNVEFLRVQADRKITVVVPLKFVGTSEAVKAGGHLVESYQEAQIECFPGDIPDNIEVDISAIVEIEQGIHFADLKISDTVKVLNPPDEIVVRVITPRAQVEEAPAAVAAVEGAAVPAAETTTTSSSEKS